MKEMLRSAIFRSALGHEGGERRIPGRLLVALAASLAWLPLKAHAAPPDMSRYMDCARSMSVAVSEQFAVLPGERVGGRGVYVYTDSNVYFVPFGAPAAQDADMREYLLRTSLTSVGEVMLSVREARAGGKAGTQPGVSFQTENIPGTLAFSPAFVVLDDRAREALSQLLRTRIAGIKDFIDDKNRYSTPAEAQKAFDRDRVLFADKLERCRMDGDPGLAAAVAEEAQKLKYGYPGLTVWEKQVKVRPAFAVPVVSSVR